MNSEWQGPKRITYLERRHDLSEQEFRAHWATTHARIAVDLPGVLSYRQNHVVGTGSVSGEEPYLVDGIVELWFGDESSAGAGFGSDVADRLIEDEKRFLSGLTGSAVFAGGPTPERPYKLWLLAQWSEKGETAGLEEFASWISDTASGLGADGHQLNLLDRDAPVLQRETLRREPRLPDAAVSFGFQACPSDAQLDELVERASATPLLVRTQALRVEELRII